MHALEIAIAYRQQLLADFLTIPLIQFAQSAARKSTSLLFVENWFRRLKAHACQAPLLQEALDELSSYQHPWIGNVELQTWGNQKHGTDWKFDPLVHHTSTILASIRAEDPALAGRLQQLWAGNIQDGTAFSSYRNRARELARVCGEALDNEPGSADTQLVERADINDGFQIYSLMRKATIFAKESTTTDFVDQDAELKKIRHKFVESGIHTYFAAYKRQLNLFVEMKLPFALPEQYNCQRMIAHLSTRCLEFKKCANEFADAVSEGRAKYTYDMVETKFKICETRHKLGPLNRGTPVPGEQLSPTVQAMLAKQQDDLNQSKQKRPQRKQGLFKPGSCPIHPESTTHSKAECYVQQKRDNFVHPITGKRGLTQLEICPKHPKTWHPADLCGDPRYMKSNRRRGGSNKQMSSMVNMLQSQQQLMLGLSQQVQQNRVMMTTGGQQLIQAMQANNGAINMAQQVPLSPQPTWPHQQLMPPASSPMRLLPAATPMQLQLPQLQMHQHAAMMAHASLPPPSAQQSTQVQSKPTIDIGKPHPRKLQCSASGALRHINSNSVGSATL